MEELRNIMIILLNTGLITTRPSIVLCYLRSRNLKPVLANYMEVAISIPQ